MTSFFIPTTIGSAVGFQCFNSALNSDFLIRPPTGKYEGKDRHKWRNAATSLLNGLIMSGIIIYCLFCHPELWIDPENYYSVQADIGLAIIVGYLLYDTFDLLVHSVLSPARLAVMAHHVFVGFSIFTLGIQRKVVGIILIGLLSEISAIFLHSRQLLLMHGVSKNSLVFRVHKLFNIFTFLFLRIVPILKVTHWSCTVTDLPVYLRWTLPAIMAIITGINLMLLQRLLGSDFLRKDDEEDHLMRN